MATNVSAVYIHVVDDVISKVREEFVNYGAGESVLNELQACGAITDVERSSLRKNAAPITPVHDLNVPYEGPAEEYETPTAEMLFPPTPLQTPIQTPLPGTADTAMYNIPTGASDYAPSPISDIRNSIDLKAGRPTYVEGREEAGDSSHQSMTQIFQFQGVASEDYNTPGDHGNFIVSNVEVDIRM
ncbi:hypothetical protein BHE74_00006438, partial [Ensete ventricosum]